MRNKQALINILGKPDPSKRFVRVLRPIGSGRYRAVDLQGRSVDVDSTSKWRAGSMVTINGEKRIVDSASTRSVIRVYQV